MAQSGLTDLKRSDKNDDHATASVQAD